MQQDIIEKLTGKDDKAACAFTEQIIAESRESDAWYAYFDAFAALLEHPKSLVRNRALHILAANAKWDKENRFDGISEDFLSHITDEKPVTARQCIKALAELGRAKPQYGAKITKALRSADFSKYKDSMRPLLARDAEETIYALSETRE